MHAPYLNFALVHSIFVQKPGYNIPLNNAMQYFLKVLLWSSSRYNRTCNVRLHRTGFTNICQI